MMLPPDSDGALADPPVVARYRELLVALYKERHPALVVRPQHRSRGIAA